MNFLNPEFLIHAVGVIGVIAIVFAESGLFFGFFLPGDSLLFTAGLFAAQGYLNIWILVIGSIIAAIVGDNVGYAFGRRVGPALFSREDSTFFHKKHVERARLFYEKHGPKTIFLARFVPIVRTFAPIVAGVGGMEYKTFLKWNIFGGITWATLLSLLGYFLGKAFPASEAYFGYIVIVIIIVSFIPVIREWAKARRNKSEV